MKTFYQTLKKSCRRFFSNWKTVLFIALVDIMFLLSLGSVYARVYSKAMVHIKAVLDMAEMNMAQLAGMNAESELAALASNYSAFMEHYRQIGHYISLLFIALLVFWCIFQGINWFITHEVAAGKKKKIPRYFGKFCLVSFIWWVVFIIIVWAGLKLSFYSSMAALPLVSSGASKLIVLILMLALFYFSYNSYALLQEHKLRRIPHELFKTAVKRYKELVPAYLFMAFVLVGEYFLFLRTFWFGWQAPLVFALVLIFPTIAWTRFYAMTALEK